MVDEVNNNVDAITTFPVETEKPIIREMLARKWYGGSSNLMLRRLAQAIAARLDKPKPTTTRASVDFLNSVVEAYRQLQPQDHN